MTAWIDSVDGTSGWPLSHISQKILESEPTGANLNAFCSIILKAIIVLIVTPLPHSFPGPIRARARFFASMTMCQTPSDYLLRSQTTTRFGLPAPKHFASLCRLHTTVTSTNPLRFTLKRVVDSMQHREPSKPLSCNINRFHLIMIFTLFGGSMVIVTTGIATSDGGGVVSGGRPACGTPAIASQIARQMASNFTL